MCWQKVRDEYVPFRDLLATKFVFPAKYRGSAKLLVEPGAESVPQPKNPIPALASPADPRDIATGLYRLVAPAIDWLISTMAITVLSWSPDP